MNDGRFFFTDSIRMKPDRVDVVVVGFDFGVFFFGVCWFDYPLSLELIECGRLSLIRGGGELRGGVGLGVHSRWGPGPFPDNGDGDPGGKNQTKKKKSNQTQAKKKKEKKRE